jgi:pyruvate/2-oxoglutarate dehydrogenase complex dihydrolipoamide acyltransferase (E2) component
LRLIYRQLYAINGVRAPAGRGRPAAGSPSRSGLSGPAELLRYLLSRSNRTMVFSICMPKIDANVREGTIGEWLKEEGQRVGEGDVLAEIITDKATFELESEHAGVLRRLVAPEKSVVPVGYVIALVSEEEDEPLRNVDEENERLMAQYRESMLFGGAGGQEPPAERPPAQEPPSSGAPRRRRATPAARRLARREGIPLQDVPAAGEVVQEEDVRRRAQAAEQEGGGTEDAG